MSKITSQTTHTSSSENLSDLFKGGLDDIQTCWNWVNDLYMAMKNFDLACKGVLNAKAMRPHLRANAIKRAALMTVQLAEHLRKRPFEGKVAPPVSTKLTPWLDEAYKTCIQLQGTFLLGKVSKSFHIQQSQSQIAGLFSPLKDFRDLLCMHMLQLDGNKGMPDKGKSEEKKGE